MTLISDSIPNLIGGISQQPAKVRLATQAEAQANCGASIVEGLSKKPPSKHVKKVASFTGPLTVNAAKAAAVHTIDKSDEHYQVFIYGTTLRVFDLTDGTEKTVSSPDGTAYLTASVSKAALSLTTVEDFTFVVNKEVVVEMEAAPADARGIEAIVFVALANYSTEYKLTLDGHTVTCKTTAFGYDGAVNHLDGPDGNGTSAVPVSISTEFIAKNLAEDLIANHPSAADYDINYAQSVIWIKRDNEAAFVLEVFDSRGNTQMTLAKETVQKLADLPVVGPHGFQVEIVGDPTTPADNYFVEFAQTNPSVTIGKGLWREIAKPGIPIALDAATMPHLLVREGNGTFTFKQAEWGDRVAGDENSAPDPSFVGQTVQDVFILRNRLGFLSGENTILSRAAGFFDFFVASATALTDADPIDEAASHKKVSVLRHALTFKKRLFVFSDTTQFELRYGDTLTSETAELVPIWEYQISSAAKPVSAGKSSLFFPIDRKDEFDNRVEASGVVEAIVEEGENVITDAREITEHVPTYLPAGLRKLAGAANEQLLLALTDEAPRAIFVYRFFYTENAQKILSSWSRWDYFNADADSAILNVDFINNVCVMFTIHADGVYMERFSVAPHQRDPDWIYQFKLDRRVDEDECSMSYDAGANETTITAPYPLSAKTMVVARFPDDHTKKPGTVALKQSFADDEIVVLGDWTSAKFFLGETYRSHYVFSPQFLRKASAGGGQEIIGTGRLQMAFYTIHYAHTGYFEVHVTPYINGETFVQKITGQILGTPEAIIGAVAIRSGQVRIPIGGKNDEVKVEIISESHLPFNLLSVDWEGHYHAQSRRL